MENVKIEDLQAQLPAYMAAAQKASTLSVTDVADYTSSVLNFWRGTSDASIPAWRVAARIIFTLSPNSATCERIFSLLDCLFGEEEPHDSQTCFKRP